MTTGTQDQPTLRLTDLEASNATETARMHERFLRGRIATANSEAAATDLEAVTDKFGCFCYFAADGQIGGRHENT